MYKFIFTLALTLSLVICATAQKAQTTYINMSVLGSPPPNPPSGLNTIYNDSAGLHCLTAVGGSCFSGSALSIQTNGTLNSNQNLLNLIAGTNITLTPSGGSVTIASTGGGGGGSAFQQNGTGLISTTTINFANTTNITWSNPTGGTLNATLVFPFISGDVFNTLGSTTLTLVGTGISAGACVKPTFDAKGRGVSCNSKIAGSTDINGTIAAANVPAFTGDASSTAGTTVLTLANTGISAGSCVKPTVDAKGRAISCTFQIAASTDIAGTFLATNMPAYTGDASSSSGSLTLSVGKINGTTVPTNTASDQALITTASATGSWVSIPSCLDGSGHLNYDNSAHTFSCGTGGGSAGTAIPLIDGVGSAGTSVSYSRQDHVHPTDTTRAADAAVVHNTGVETAAGSKTWNDPAHFLSGLDSGSGGDSFVALYPLTAPPDPTNPNNAIWNASQYAVYIDSSTGLIKCEANSGTGVNCLGTLVAGTNITLNVVGGTTTISADVPTFNTPSNVSFVTSPGLLTPITLASPSADTAYRFILEAIETVAGSGSGCSTQGSVGFELNWTDADTNTTVGNTAINIPLYASNGTTSSSTLVATTPISAGAIATSVAREIRAKAGTSVTLTPDQVIATNCPTVPIVKIRPILLPTGY